MRALTLDELRELAPAFVMGTLSDDERAQFNAAMADPATAEALQPEIDAHREATEFLATMQPVVPPPSLKQRLEARIAEERRAEERRAEERRIEALRSDGELDSMRTAETAELPTLSTSNHNTSGSRPIRATRATPPRSAAMPRGPSSTPAWATAGLLGLALAASAVFAVRLNSRVQQLENDLALQQLANQKTVDRLAVADSTVQALTSADNDMVLVRLASNVSDPRLQVYWNTRTGQAVINASGFAPVAKDRAYCLWVIRNGKPEALALFTPDTEGKRLLNSVAVPRDAEGIAAFAVTEEPATGSPQPTMTPFLVGAVPATR